MEERIVDKDDPRLIRIKRTDEGETDAVDALAEGEEEEVLLSLPEDEYDEELVGLTPSQLQKELERRAKAEEEARAECARLVEEGEKHLSEREYEKAETFFAQAACYTFADERIMRGLWIARTRDFTEYEPFYNAAYAEEFSASEEDVKKFVRGRAEERLRKELEEAEEEERRIAPDVEAKQEERRKAFAGNKRFYSVRFCAMLGAFFAAVVALAVSAGFIVRTQSPLPVIFTAVFGACALAFCIASLALSRKLLVAHRLCRENEKLSSTEAGARLSLLRNKIYCLGLILND